VWDPTTVSEIIGLVEVWPSFNYLENLNIKRRRRQLKRLASQKPLIHSGMMVLANNQTTLD
jgi:hypothetical protein